MPPTGTQFFEDFTGDDIEDFKATFDWQVVDLWRFSNGWQGHHDMQCNVPTTERRLNHEWPISNTNPGTEFWLCGPSGPATDHLMTSNGDNGTFGITAFSPKQSFTGNRVCWDVNLTEARGGRLWWEVQLISAAHVASNPPWREGFVGGADYARGTAQLAYGHGRDSTFMKRSWPADSVVFDFTQEVVRIFHGQSERFFGGWDSRWVTQDRAGRAPHCMISNPDGSLTFTQQRGSQVYTRTLSGIPFPKPYRVIFSAHNYNAGKDGTESNMTWHWDNLRVTGS